MTADEMKADLAATQRDIEALDSIAANLRVFIYEAHGEDRSAFKVDLLKYEGLASDGRRLRKKIINAMNQ